MNKEEYLYSYLNGLISYPFTRDSRNHIMELFNNLQEENEHLRTQVNIYENPDDLTLFYMWIDEKAKEKNIKKLIKM